MKILFLCVANSARSQIAEGLAKKIFPAAEVMSAGSKPSIINPFAIQVLKEDGIDPSAQFSKGIDDLPANFQSNLDLVITLCAEEVCPILMAPRARRIHLPFPDPVKADESPEILLERFRSTRENIRKALSNFKASLGV